MPPVFSTFCLGLRLCGCATCPRRVFADRRRFRPPAAGGVTSTATATAASASLRAGDGHAAAWRRLFGNNRYGGFNGCCRRPAGASASATVASRLPRPRPSLRECRPPRRRDDGPCLPRTAAGRRFASAFATSSGWSTAPPCVSPCATTLGSARTSGSAASLQRRPGGAGRASRRCPTFRRDRRPAGRGWPPLRAGCRRCGSRNSSR
jgi:hypothetical protein